jgi:hypothetical protein
MAKLLVTEHQVRFARAFLKAIKGNQNNGYLLLAVIAWLKNDADAKHFFRYKSTTAGATALARVLMYNPKRKEKGYLQVLKAARRMGKEKGYVQQAKDFLGYLAISKFQKSHYGSPDGNEVTNKLIKTWLRLTGGKAIPNAWFIDTVVVKSKAKEPKPKKPPFRQARSGSHALPLVNFLQPYAARDFYAARPHIGDFILPVERW